MLRHRQLCSMCACLLLAVVASCAMIDDAATAAEAARGSRPAVALTDEGPVRGVATTTTRVFRGIPYAAAPVGDLRWRPPQRAARRHGLLDATKFAAHCPQPAGAFGQASTSEDCLFLNVWAPSRH